MQKQNSPQQQQQIQVLKSKQKCFGSLSMFHPPSLPSYQTGPLRNMIKPEQANDQGVLFDSSPRQQFNLKKIPGHSQNCQNSYAPLQTSTRSEGRDQLQRSRQVTNLMTCRKSSSRDELPAVRKIETITSNYLDRMEPVIASTKNSESPSVRQLEASSFNETLYQIQTHSQLQQLKAANQYFNLSEGFRKYQLQMSNNTVDQTEAMSHKQREPEDLEQHTEHINLNPLMLNKNIIDLDAEEKWKDTLNNFSLREDQHWQKGDQGGIVETVDNYREEKLEDSFLEITTHFKYKCEDDSLLEKTIQKHAAYYHKKFGTITECQTQGLDGKFLTNKGNYNLIPEFFCLNNKL